MTAEDFKVLIEPCFVQGPTRDRAVETFCIKLRPYFWVLLSRLSPADPSIAEDALQAAFVKFIDIFNGSGERRILSPGYYVTIAKHCLIDEIRRRKKYVELDELLLEHEAIPEAKGAVKENHEDLVLITMERMGQKCRFVLERYYLADIKGPQLAKELGISPQSVPMIVKRCRDELRSLLKAQGLTR